MFCTNCGAENKEESKFCKNCGKSLVVDAIQKETVKNNKIPLVVMIVVAVVLLTFIMIVYILSQNKEDIISETKTEQEVNLEVTEETVNNSLELNENESQIEEKDNNVQLMREEEIVYFAHYYDVNKYPGYSINKYDQDGNITYTDTDYGKWTYEYDFHQNGVIAAQYSYTMDGTCTYVKEFDEYGNITREEALDSDMEAFRYEYEYDNEKNATKKTTFLYYPSENEESFYELVLYTYDETDNVLSTTIYYDENMADPVVEYINEYDENGELILTYTYNETMPDGMGYKMEYDPLLQIEKHFSNWGNGLFLSEYIEYNSLGDMVSRKFYDGNGTETEAYQYKYEVLTDEKNNILEKTVYVNNEMFMVQKNEYY